MNKALFFAIFVLASCAGPEEVHAPVGQGNGGSELAASVNRAKAQNAAERRQIEQWMAGQSEVFYPMPLNYWINLEGLESRRRRKEGERVSYLFRVYDFSGKPIGRPKEVKEAVLGHFEGIKAVEDALGYLHKGEEATLLVPSVLAYGTYGDGDEIMGNMPLIIKLKLL
ncbi:FKBP-type peptidyl-prolyl cis-trans isomerase [Bergeyella sp. RCAD1439]|uniref:FKBP-type peptidyl-prolyl cis-trans isomerase n=1 Tax=Bergeyella anatis TaxID=3113737 RepID=UPI002E188B2C|nr:FKBP-type peptidyl-prolyl cis-trans isomerase [Bergeyella sp. RCAD1439]